MNLPSKILRSLIAIAACAAFAGGCGDDDNPGTGSITPGNNQVTPDAGADADISPEADSADEDSREEADITEPDAERPDEGPFCDSINLGTLGPNQSVSSIGDLADAENNFHLSCAAGIARELVYHFSVEQPSRVTLRALSETVGNWSLQINRGTCAESSELACFGSANQTFFAEAGIDYYLFLEPTDRASVGKVSLNLSTEALGCYPAASAVCNGDEIERCHTDYTPSTSTCPAGCSDDACDGDTCENALEMDPSGTMIVEGSLAGLTDAYNFRGRTECFESGNAVPTREKDIVVALNGLRAGQVVHIDASEELGDQNDNAIFIVEDCGAAPTCVAGGDSSDEKLRWEVPADGDYLVIIDLISTISDTFIYQITVDE